MTQDDQARFGAAAMKFFAAKLRTVDALTYQVWFEDLIEYPIGIVEEAFERLRKTRTDFLSSDMVAGACQEVARERRLKLEVEQNRLLLEQIDEARNEASAIPPEKIEKLFGKLKAVLTGRAEVVL